MHWLEELLSTHRRPIKHGFLGGLGWFTVGTGLGMAIEGERRRRNLEENLEDGTIKQ